MIVIDTHAWIGWVTGSERLPKKAKRAIEKATQIGLAAISPWEFALKAASGRMKVKRPTELWIEEALAFDDRIALLPLTANISVTGVGFSWKHADPADRMIVATAYCNNAPLITADPAIHDAELVKCIWE